MSSDGQGEPPRALHQHEDPIGREDDRIGQLAKGMAPADHPHGESSSNVSFTSRLDMPMPTDKETDSQPITDRVTHTHTHTPGRNWRGWQSKRVISRGLIPHAVPPFRAIPPKLPASASNEESFPPEEESFFIGVCVCSRDVSRPFWVAWHRTIRFLLGFT